MKIKLDENLGNTAAQVFMDSRFDVETVKQEGLAGAVDQQIIAACQVEERCLVTLDLDFSNPFIFAPELYFGIAVLRLPPHPSIQEIQAYCQTLVTGLKKNDITGKLWVIHNDKIRVYQPKS